MLQFQLRYNPADLVVFERPNRLIGRGDGEQAFEQRELLVPAGELVELAGDDEVLGPAKAQPLSAGNLHHERRLRLWQPSELRHQRFHFARLVVGDLMIGPCHTAEDVREAGDVARADRLEAVERALDLSEAVHLGRRRRVILKAKPSKDRHSHQNIANGRKGCFRLYIPPALDGGTIPLSRM